MAIGHSQAISPSRLIRTVKRRLVSAALTSALGLIVLVNPATFTGILVHVRDLVCQSDLVPSPCYANHSVDHVQLRLVNIEEQLKHVEAMITSLNKSVIKGMSDSSEAHHSTDPGQVRLVKMEEQLKRVEAMITSLNKSVIKADCIVDLASYGSDDPPKYYGYVTTSGGSSEHVHVLDQHGNHRSVQRGLTLMELDIATCTTRNRQRFDTYGSHDNKIELLESLQLKRRNTIIVGVTADTAENVDNASLRNKVGSFFGSYDIDLSELKFRGKLAFILQIGSPRKTVYQIKPKGGESLRIKIEVHGSTVQDVTFKQV